jgi:hypothetical protein
MFISTAGLMIAKSRPYDLLIKHEEERQLLIEMEKKRAEVEELIYRDM